jgi:hypothetical protein
LFVIEVQTIRLEVLVQRVVSPLDTGSIHGRGYGFLARDRGVAVTFLIDQSDFQHLRERLLRGDGEVSFGVSMNDVTAIDAAPNRQPVLA